MTPNATNETYSPIFAVSTARIEATMTCDRQKNRYERLMIRTYGVPISMTETSFVKIAITCAGNRNAARVISAPIRTANRTPMDTILRMLTVSRLPQYCAARMRIAPSMPPMNICKSV